MLIERLRAAAGHWQGTAIAPLAGAAADRIEALDDENERLCGLLMAAQDVLLGAVLLNSAEHDAFMELLTLAIDGRMKERDALIAGVADAA